MTDATPLDITHAAMQADPDDNTARLRFYGRLADSELFLLLEAEPGESDITPRTFDISDGSFVLAFDREERLSRFTGAPTPYIALSGRALAQMLQGQRVGLGVNLDVAPSEILIPAGAIEWLTGMLAQTPDQVEADIAELRPPAGLPEQLLVALDAKLATAGGLAECAFLAATRSKQGGPGHILAFIDAPVAARSALIAAVSEALTFCAIDAGTLDIGFFDASDPMSARLAVAGLRFDLPKPDAPPEPAAPGSDPGKPPILR